MSEIQNRMARAAWPCGQYWTDHLALVYETHASETVDMRLNTAAEYLAHRAFYYLDRVSDIAMIGDIAAMRTILSEDRQNG